MPDIREATTVAAGATVTNLLAGNTFEFVGLTPMLFQLFAVQDGVLAPELTLDVNFSNAIVAQALAVPLIAAAGTGPNVNEHKIAEGVAMPGDRLVIKAVNTAAVAVANLRFLVKLNSTGA